MELPSLPMEGQLISTVSFSGDRISIHLIPEAVSRADGHAYVITASEPKEAEASLEALERFHAGDGYVYLRWREGRLVIDDDQDGEIEIDAREFAGETVELSTAELREALEFWRKLYESANEFGTTAQLRLRRVQELAIEQQRRTFVKAAGHSPESSAGVLYSQQVEFLQRVLRASEGHDA